MSNPIRQLENPIMVINKCVSFYFTIRIMNDESQLSTYCSQTFVILDKWLNQVGGEKGEQALGIVKSALQNNIRANMTYYEGLAKEAENNGEHELASRNRLLAKLYKGLVE